MNSIQLNLPPHTHTQVQQLVNNTQQIHIYTHTRMHKQKCASASSKNKFECCHDVIDVVNIWRINTVKTPAYAGNRHPADTPLTTRRYKQPK